MTSFKLKISLLLTIAVMMGSVASAAIPSGYYDNARGKTQQALLTALETIVNNGKSAQSYAAVWTAFRTTDADSNGKLIDMYSNKLWTYSNDQCGNYDNVGDCYNREHSMPKSWFGGSTSAGPGTDLFHMYPTDGKVNGQRSNYPFGECANGTRLSYGSYVSKGKLGTCTYSGYSGDVFEPDDEYKGDFARTYFYMVTAYNSKQTTTSWKSNSSGTNLNGTSYPCFNTWSLNMLLEWHRNDPVSEKETKRNDAVYAIQKNRNPYIDHPELVEYVWGDNKNDAAGWQGTASTTPTLSAPTAGSTVSVGTTTANTAITKSVTIAGSNLTSAITLSLSGTNSGLFALSTTSVSASAANSGTTVTVTYTPTANGTHTATLTLSSSDFSTRTVTLTGTASDSGSGGGDSGSGAYVKVTTDDDIAAGDEILIVYEGSTNGPVILNGSLGNDMDNNKNGLSVTIDNETIEATTEVTAAAFILEDSSDSGYYYIKSKGGYYIGSTSTSSNTLLRSTTDKYNNSIAFSSGNAIILGGRVMRFNNATNTERFRYYSGTTQQPVAIYKKQAGGSSEPEPDPTLTVSPSSASLTATAGTASEPEEIIIDSENNSSDITVSVPSSSVFELSTDQSTWASQLTIDPEGETVFVRVKASATAGNPTATLTATVGTLSATCSLSATVTAAGGSTLVDEITQSVTGITNSSYSYWEATGASGTKYAGCVAGNSTNIQINTSTSSSNRGIWNTSSIGNATKVTVTWGQTPSSNRGLQIYGKSTAYEWTDFAPNSTTMGTLLGELDSSTTTVNITGSYAYIAIYAKGGVVYPSAIGITWSTGGGTTPTPELIVDPASVTIAATNVGQTATGTFTVTGSNLTDAVNVAITGDYLSVSPATITAADAANGATVTVTYAPEAADNHSGTVTLTSEGAATVTVPVTASATMPVSDPVLLTATEAQIGTTQFTASWTDSTADAYVDSYTLYINKKAETPTPTSVTLLAEDFSSMNGNGGNDGDFATASSSATTISGWTCDKVYPASACVKLGSSSAKGTITTPALGQATETATLTFRAAGWDASGDNKTVNISVNNGGSASPSSITLTQAEFNTFTIVLTNITAASTITIQGGANKSRFFLDDVKVVTGSGASSAPRLKAVSDNGNADDEGRTISGITDKSHTVDQLTAGSTYIYKVKAVYVNGDESQWTKEKEVTLKAAATLGEAVGTSVINLPVNIAYVDGNGIAYGCASAGENQITEGNASEKSDNAGTYSDDFTKYDQRDWVAISGLTNPSQYIGKTISGFKGSRDSNKPGYYYVATSQPTSVTAQSGDNNVPANEYQVHNLVASPDDNDYVRPQVYEYTTKFYASLKKENNTWKAFGTSAGNDVSILLDTSLFASTTGWVESSGSNYNTLEGIFVTTGGASSSPRLREVDLGSQSYKFLITKAPTTEDVPTGINGIGSDNEAMKVRGIYNLQGQRVRETVPGQLYIINGKKTMVNSVIRDTDF